MTELRLAIAGDLHGAWGSADEALLEQLQPDAVLFVGDLSDGDLRLTRRIAQLSFPIAVILGNHDRGKDKSGNVLRQQIALLGDIHCGWDIWTSQTLPFSVVGGRPCSSGGGFHLSRAVQAVYGPVTFEQSVDLIVAASEKVPDTQPLVVMAHCGPTGLGSNHDSPCGRDWKKPSLDWGDRDLAIALDRMMRRRRPDLVVFGHMHHQLKRGSGVRCSLLRDRKGIAYINAACVPRSGNDGNGRLLHHLSWAEFDGPKLKHLSHRWYTQNAELVHQEALT